MLAELIRGCATWSDAQGRSVALSPALLPVLAGLIEVESSGHAWAIDDDNNRKGYEPDSDFDAAASQAATIIARNAQRFGETNVRVDLGLTQIDYVNFAKYRVSVPEIMHPCKNIEVGAHMLSDTFDDEEAALRARGVPEGQRFAIAVDRALEIYNSGSPTGNPRYARDIEAAMRGSYVAQTVASFYARPFAVASPGRKQPDALFAGSDAVPFEGGGDDY